MLNSAVAPMAKKTSKPIRNKPVSDVPGDDSERNPMIVQMRGSPEFKAYVNRFAEYDRNTVAKMVERAIIHFAKATGFDEAPPRR